MSSAFGTLFKISTWGESHGGSIGVVVDGCPPRLPLSAQDIQQELDRRRPGQSRITSPRNEPDVVSILSGTYQGLTLGTPIAMMVLNKDADPSAYTEIKNKFRPSHADYTYQEKYGIRNPEGGGRASARETIGRVAAGAIAKKILALSHNIQIRAYVHSVHTIKAPNIPHFPSLEEIDATPIRCPHLPTAEQMIKRIEATASSGDSLGGTILCRIQNVPPGLGSPVFDRLEADLAKAMLSLPATKGFEVGSGFSGTLTTGIQHNDPFAIQENTARTITNNSGGIQGGISNGEEIYFRVAFKPTATVLQNQKTIDTNKVETELLARGRHDPCVLPRATPIVEAMTALVLIDHLMRHTAQNLTFDFSSFKTESHTFHS